MSFFSSALSSALAASPSLTQRSLAEAAKMSPPQLSRYARGHSSPPPAALQSILAVVTPEHRPAILLGYLRDLIPDDYRGLVHLSPIGEDPKTAEMPPGLNLPTDIDPELKKMVELYAALGMRHTQVRDMMRSFLRLVAPDQAP